MGCTLGLSKYRRIELNILNIFKKVILPRLIFAQSQTKSKPDCNQLRSLPSFEKCVYWKRLLESLIVISLLTNALKMDDTTS